jgi:phage/plasmid-associated DNA primase
MDKVGQFIEDKCVTGVGNLSVKKDNLYNVYKEWCLENNRYAEQKRKFGEKLLEKEYGETVKKIGGKATRVWLGIDLLGGE